LKNKFKNIDELMQKTFDGFEADVDPSVWSNVQSSINAGATSTVASSVVAKLSLFKIAAGIIAVGAIATATYFLSKDAVLDRDNNQNDAISQTKEVEPKVIAENIEQKSQKTEEEKVEIITSENKEFENYSSTKIETSDLVEEQDMVEVSEEKVIGTGISTSTDNTNSTNQLTVDSESAESDKNANTNISQSVTEESFEVKISATTTEGFAPLEVEFNILGDVVNASWDFSDGSSSNQVNAFHTFENPGKYVVSLNVLDKNNRDKKITKTIVVKSNFPARLEPIQNVITPNGDNQNDVFRFEGENILRLEVFILDRTGNVINSLKSIDDVWDGRDQAGKIVMEGTYYLSGVAKGVDGDVIKIQSTINVLK
jgi:gliding motility-associated-like protein